jgi:hypothetical protein
MKHLEFQEMLIGEIVIKIARQDLMDEEEVDVAMYVIDNNIKVLNNLTLVKLNGEFVFFKDGLEIDEFELMLEIEEFYSKTYSKILSKYERSLK